jgi:alpha-L-fucosidase
MKSMEARESYIQDMKAQLKELVDRYDPAVMWFDGDWTRNDGKATLESWWTKQDGEDLYQYMKEISPDILVNERVCRDFDLGDFECPEQSVPAKALDRPWETCQTMNGAWGYKKSYENNYRSAKSIVQELATVASRSGNYLLNVGPKGDGSLTSGSMKVLKGMAKWMSGNSESIYGTTGNPFSKDPSWGTYTKKDSTVYAHVFKMPKNRTVQLSRYKGKKPTKIYLVSNPKASLKVTYKKGKILIKIPKKLVNAKDTVIAADYAS